MLFQAPAEKIKGREISLHHRQKQVERAFMQENINPKITSART